MQGYRCRLGFMGVLIGCLLLAQPAAWTQPPNYGGTLRVAWEADVTGFDPHTSPGVQSQYMVGNLFNSLVTIDTDLNFVPELAESWEMQEEGKTWVFHLRKGVKFHDGTDFDAAAVAWNFQRITDPAEGAFVEGFFDPIAAVEPIDAHTVKFILKHPSLTLLPTLAVYRVGFLLMFSTSYKSWGKEDVRLHPAGTGPFKLAKWEQNNVIVLEKNEHYFKKGLPYLDRIEFKVMKDGVTRATALRAGEVDFANYVPREYVERLAKDPKLQVFRGRETLHLIMLFHNGRKPFDDVQVRQALAGYGIDRRIWLRRLLKDRDMDQILTTPSNVFDPYSRRFVLDSRKGPNPSNHQNARVNELLDQLAQTMDPAEYTRLGHELQRHVIEQMIYLSATSLPTIEAARDHVKGYEFLHGFKKRFEGAWLDKAK